MEDGRAEALREPPPPAVLLFSALPLEEAEPAPPEAVAPPELLPCPLLLEVGD